MIACLSCECCYDHMDDLLSPRGHTLSENKVYSLISKRVKVCFAKQLDQGMSDIGKKTNFLGLITIRSI